MSGSSTILPNSIPIASAKRKRTAGQILRIRFVEALLHRELGPVFVVVLIVFHVVIWTAVLTILKWGQGIHGDSAEAYAWGQQLLWGYGKHPPMSGWIARLWFSIFPETDWAMYGLAMVVIGVSIWVAWEIGLRVVGRRRAVLFILVLMIYPIFNFKGFKYNADLLQIPFFLLVVLSFLVAFKSRSIGSGLMLGFICALAVLVKYWALIIVAAIGLAALTHPDRALFFRSRVPYIAAAIFIITLLPHLSWLMYSDFAPFHYASIYVSPQSYAGIEGAYILLRHHAAMLVPVMAALTWALWLPNWYFRRSGAASPDVARHICIIVAVLIVLPAVAASLLGIHMKSDWGIPLFSLVPLAAIVAIGSRVQRKAIARAGAVYALMTGVALAIAFPLMAIKSRNEPERFFRGYADLAKTVTQLWHDRYSNLLPVAAGAIDAAAGISFYSPDHPLLFSELDPYLATWIDLNEIRRTGFIVVCPLHTPCDDRAQVLGRIVEQVRVYRLFGPGQPSKQYWTVLIAGPDR
jgi:hypothetical protein